MDKRSIIITLAVAVVLLIVGYIFIDNVSWLEYTDSAILYLAAVVGAGCFWIGRKK